MPKIIRTRWLQGTAAVAVITSALILGGVFISRAQEPEGSTTSVLDADCPYFGALRKKTADQQLANGLAAGSGQYNLSRITEEVVRQLPDLPATASQDGNAAVTSGLVVP